MPDNEDIDVNPLLKKDAQKQKEKEEREEKEALEEKDKSAKTTALKKAFQEEIVPIFKVTVERFNEESHSPLSFLERESGFSIEGSNKTVRVSVWLLNTKGSYTNFILGLGCIALPDGTGYSMYLYWDIKEQKVQGSWQLLEFKHSFFTRGGDGRPEPVCLSNQELEHQLKSMGVSGLPYDSNGITLDGNFVNIVLSQVV